MEMSYSFANNARFINIIEKDHRIRNLIVCCSYSRYFLSLSLLFQVWPNVCELVTPP